jgi:hypothetical protein
VTPMPGPRGLLLRLALAAAVGAFLVFCVVLPAEFRVDPTGFGRLTGLLALTTPIVTQPSADQPAPAAAVDIPPQPPEPERQLDPGIYGSDVRAVVNRASPAVSRVYPDEFKSDIVEIPLPPDGQLEYKIKMKQGRTVLYEWSVDRGKVYYDFHGHPEGHPELATSYREVQEDTGARGAFVAPVEGIHGWYWLNLTGQPLTIRLRLTGFYESHERLP